VSKKPKHRSAPHLPPAALKGRVQKAMQEGRFQQALELGKQLYKQDPTPPNRELLQQIYLRRAQQLRQQGHTRDARTVLENALQLGATSPPWLEQLAEELAANGDTRRALDLLERVPGSSAYGRVLAPAADWAVQQGSAGRGQLPESLRAPFELVLKAFREAEAGQDDQARETLQGIGLQSPFLEWKLLLRGLLAYYHNDDVRALENWQRLSPERLPAKVAAPLRFQIDPAYRQAQPPETQVGLQKQADRLQTSGLVQPLRVVQALLADPEALPQAFRQVESVLPALKQQAPHLVSRLAACFYWSIVTHGQPEDLTRYTRAFGVPADDSELNRLRALTLEHLFEMQEAHKYWQRFEESVASHPASWPGEVGPRVRAMVWRRMGENAANVPDQDRIDMLPPFLRDHPSRPQPLVPSAEKCFQRSLELAPDELATHEALFHHYLHQDKKDKAEKAARQLLEHFPDHVHTLEELAALRSQQGDPAESLTLLQRALRQNPLDRDLRNKVSTAHVFMARAHAEAGRFDDARAEYQSALSSRVGKDESSVLCKWAACEFKAANPERAEELLQKAQAEAGNRLAVAFSVLIEVIRLKLPRKLKDRFNKDFNAGLAEPPTGQAAAALASTASVHRVAGVTYYAQKTHEKKVLSYLDKALKAEFTEDELEAVCAALLGLEALKLLRRYTVLGRRRFPRNPRFYLLEAESYFAQGPYNFPAWEVQPLLKQAHDLALELPPNDKQKAMLELIEQRQQMLGVSNFILGGGMFNDVFGGMYDDEYDDEYEDEFDDEFDDGW
jgi:tetratricopeptide (TPR) repeat protein